ncbi:MAG TPA: ABC transporter substrate-binding protein [Geminicoccus sp.]|jgi:putative spermidine/putrescine transport system substrate-binding protein|uniref:ABC transporter substrate-binding protein n=1 Tax=Geminicoccus sp. TaxID=2024832 RepID=UPI002E35BB9B|nr:ABC transporter substrate-binding protein [Geminicoccus sp.]HEX2526279.1 ABC transporter substrate-binding protein [Geminicoccus sp.]
MKLMRLLPGLLGCLLATTALADEITVASGGGIYQDAQRAAFFDPTAKKLGITIKEATTNGIPEIRVQVQSKSVIWDIANTAAEECAIGSKEGLFEPLDTSVVDTSGIDPKLVGPDWVANLYYSTVMAWNTDAIGQDGNLPKSWADFFDTEKFPGDRGIYDHPRGNLEAALLADGVPPDQLYPLDVERAFKKLEELKPDITVWWSSGAQSAQLIKDGEVDLIQIWNGRIAAAMKDGAKADYSFDQGILMADCFVVPKGAPNKDLAMKALGMFIAPEQQALLPLHIAYGPINQKAFDQPVLTDELKAKINSSPENAAKQIVLDVAWWGENGAAMMERWQNFKQQ